MSQRTALRAADHHFHFRFCRLRNRLFGMFENHSSGILAIGYQLVVLEIFALRLGTKQNIFNYACISRPLSSNSATRIVPDNSGLFLLLFVSRYGYC